MVIFSIILILLVIFIIWVAYGKKPKEDIYDVIRRQVKEAKSGK